MDNRVNLFVIVLSYLSICGDGLECVDTVNVRQQGTGAEGTTIQVIVPRFEFSCNGRITSYLISLDLNDEVSGEYPSVQVWHPTSSTVYTRVDTECALTANDISNMRDYYLGNVSCNGNNRIEFQSGDVIGYHQGDELRYRLWTIETMGYTSYYHDESNPLTTFNINNVDNTIENRQPLIQVMYDIRCDDLSNPANGQIASCSSDRVGVGYEGDTCSFTCNAGYVLNGSDTRTCQSNGNWSGSDDVCRRVQCEMLAPPTNGDVACMIFGITLPSYEDTCSFTCNTGYELTGSDIRTCQSNGSWNGSDTMCIIRGCSVPLNGQVDCGSGLVDMGLEGDNCTFSCDPGYMLQGSVTSGICENTGNWSGGLPSCVPLNCTISVQMLPHGIAFVSSSSCDMTYQSQCTVSCDEGFTGDNVTYLCNVTSDPTMVDWVPIGGMNISCDRVQCSSLTNPNNGMINCSLGDDGVFSYEETCIFTCNTGYELNGSKTRTCQSNGNWNGSTVTCGRVQCPAPPSVMLQCPNTTGVFEDTCTFYCNAGYELQGSNNGTCLANQSWSGGDPICEPLRCSDVTMVVNNIMSSSCDMTYQSQCTVSCDEGFTGDNVTYLCNVTSDLTMVEWVPIDGVNVMCKRVQCPILINGTLQCPNGTTAGVFEDTCTFSCNAGYELQGSNNGTCLANQSWSGGDPICVALNCSTSPPLNNSQLQSSCDTQYQSTCTTVCVDGYTGVGGSYTCVVTDEDTNSVGWNGSTSCQRVNCSSLGNPNNGMISCLLGDDGVPSYEDTCNLTCNTGNELTGSDTRTCQSNGSWSGTKSMCERVQCPAPLDVTFQCINGSTGVFEDTCTFSCNAGYKLQGSNNRNCLANRSWSEGDPICVALNCSTSPPLSNSQLQSSCDTQYQSTCTTVCVDGYTGVGGSYTCVVTDENTNSVGWNGSTSCQRVNCSSLTNPNNGIINCSLGDDGVSSYEDICNFTCNTGYELTGSDIRTCQSDGSWSGSESMCRRVQCSAPTSVMLQCPNTTALFEDTCTFSCNAGYESQGSKNGTCLANQSWSGGDPICEPLRCSDVTMVADDIISSLCDMTYQSQCTVSCDEGFTGDDVSYLCNVTSDPTMVDWVPIGGVDVMCERAAVSDSKDESSAGAIAGGVIAGIVIFLIVCVVVGLFLYKQRRKHVYNIKQSKDLRNNNSENNTASTILMQNCLYTEDKHFTTDYDYIEDENDAKKSTIMSNQSHYSVPGISIYSIPEGDSNDKAENQVPSPYEIPNEAIYEDPGVKKEKIYEWFDKKKFRKLKRTEITIHHQIGSGEFGNVSLAHWKDTLIAVKSLNSQCSESDRIKFLREAAIMGQFLHKNIVKFYGVVTEEENMMIVLEYVPKGDLREVLLKTQIKKEELYNPNLPIKLLNFCRQIAAGMNYLANKQFVHRDLATRNILVSSDDLCKIADFGMARDVTDDNFYVVSGGKIPAKWTAPEALLHQKYTVLSDIWSYGCVLYEIWSLGHKPFEDKSINEAIELLCKGCRLPPPPGCPRQLYQTMIDCWNENPEKRPLYSAMIAQFTEDSLSWSDEDKHINEGKAAILGNPLSDGYDLFSDIQLIYRN